MHFEIFLAYISETANAIFFTSNIYLLASRYSPVE